MPHRSRPLAFATLFVALLAGSPALASTVVPLSLAGLTARSDRVIEGRVISVRYAKGPVLSPVVTFTTIRVTRDLAGSGAQSVVVHQLGGLRRGLRSRVVGDPIFHVGEDVVLFLRREPGQSRYVLTALGQATFRIEVVHGRKLAVRDLGGVSFVAPKGTKAARLAGQTTARPVRRLSLRALAQAVRDAAQVRQRPASRLDARAPAK